MFFNDTGNGIKVTEFGNILGNVGGDNFGGIMQLTEDQIKSMLPSKMSIDELEETYGVEAQNRALREVRKMEKNEEKDFIKMLRPKILEQVQQNIVENVKEKSESQDLER